MFLFVICYVLYVIILKKILQYILFMSMEFNMFHGMFSILGISGDTVVLLWNCIYIILSIMPVIMLFFKKTRDKSIIISSILSLMFIGGGILIGICADNHFEIYNKELWENYPKARSLMLDDIKVKFENKCCEDEIVKALGNCYKKTDNGEEYYIYYYLEGYYDRNTLLKIGFNKNTGKCVSVAWGLSS